ncbi:hypothetical protein [Salibacterium qingdaonense]|uniref:Uncharacterized protein n=1 Tax=Salibacterium qingdaonense TaxID=266892 RepID=A0A1I4L9A8_9BACI|nr:hypothetical protein [Salibacterium qingdaonense]SFL87456.1 hypothetical protein SAMN04488054_10733 [Salibacterium qingdaonense]
MDTSAPEHWSTFDAYVTFVCRPPVQTSHKAVHDDVLADAAGLNVIEGFQRYVQLLFLCLNVV